MTAVKFQNYLLHRRKMAHNLINLKKVAEKTQGELKLLDFCVGYQLYYSIALNEITLIEKMTY